MKFKPAVLFQAVIILSVIAAIVTGFMVVGSPSQERATRLDQQRANDLQSISSAIDQYYNANGRYMLPPTLDALRSEPNTYISSIIDPQSTQEYGYQAVSSTAYQLCAVFQTDTTNGPQQPGTVSVVQPASVPGQPAVWSHGIGNACFSFNVAIWPVPPKAP
ncbi:MAG: hypothetical protein WA001_03905 [Patescibacteria group bacterium]